MAEWVYLCSFCPGAADGESAGLPCCAACLRELVIERHQVVAHGGRVLNGIRRMGFAIPPTLSIGIVDAIGSESGIFHRPGAFVLGLTTITTKGSEVEEIDVKMVSALPSIGFEKVLAHEMGHVIAGEAGLRLRTPEQAEGFAEFVSMQYLLRFSGRQGVWDLAQRMLEDESEYGRGLRQTSELVEELGFDGFLKSITT